MVILVLILLGCAPSPWRMPGPLDRLGQGSTEALEAYLARNRKAADTPTEPGKKSSAANADARQIASAARSFLGDSRLVVDGESYRFDCSGLVEASLAKAGRPQTGSSAMLYDAARESGVLHRRRRPTPGDIAFFDNTYDRDKNGVNDDAISQTAVVTAIHGNGTVEMVHTGSGGVVKLTMNLLHPHDHNDGGGGVINDYLRAKSKRDPSGTEYLAGELWVGFASFWSAKVPRGETD